MVSPDIEDRILFAPEAVFASLNPTHPIAWGLVGLLHFIVVMLWLPVAVTIAIILTGAKHILSSWQNRTQNGRDNY